jgi:hypothetical protein
VIKIKVGIGIMKINPTVGFKFTFPEYGWIDFDTTVGNDEAEQSPTPDGTPPMEPPRPICWHYLVKL